MKKSILKNPYLIFCDEETAYIKTLSHGQIIKPKEICEAIKNSKSEYVSIKDINNEYRNIKKEWISKLMRNYIGCDFVKLYAYSDRTFFRPAVVGIDI